MSGRPQQVTQGGANLRRFEIGSKSKVPAATEISNWASFRDFALGLRPNEFIFRGQSKDWPLRTSFHRTHRKDLIRFINQDVPYLVHRLSSFTKHIYNLADPTLNAGFWNLIQHHGYPTPLLDWTYSPFVAAYFAFRDEPKPEESIDGKVRIFIFDRKRWEEKYSQLTRVTFARPHFSIIEPPAFENDRATPQQSLMSVTNVDDIERLINLREYESDTTYLHAVDIPISERRDVLNQLSLMGLGAGSLFPGLDGICAEVRNKFF